MKYICIFLAAVGLVACGNRGAESQEAVRQGVIDYLSTKRNMNVSQMNITVNSVVFRGSEADAVVAFAPKGSSPGQGMEMRYTLEKQGNRWVVKGRSDVGSPHEGAAGAGGANPHGGAMPGAPGAAPGGALPPGHPSMGDTKK